MRIPYCIELEGHDLSYLSWPLGEPRRAREGVQVYAAMADRSMARLTGAWTATDQNTLGHQPQRCPSSPTPFTAPSKRAQAGESIADQFDTRRNFELVCRGWYESDFKWRVVVVKGVRHVGKLVRILTEHRRALRESGQPSPKSGLGDGGRNALGHDLVEALAKLKQLKSFALCGPIELGERPFFDYSTIK